MILAVSDMIERFRFSGSVAEHGMAEEQRQCDDL